MDRNCLSYWFPILEKTGVPVPKTQIIRTNCNLVWLVYDKPEPEGLDSFLSELADAIRSNGYPAFLRTGYTSAKHFWKDTCYIENAFREYLKHHVTELVEFSECAQICGLPTDVWVVREFLKTEPIFHAFNGKMPVNKERRYFIKDRNVIGHHPYWPADAICSPDHHDWWRKLDTAQHESKQEIELLTSMAKLVAGYFDDAWSVDFLYTVNGWVVNDMALAENSYCMFEAPFAPKPQEIGQ